MTKNEALKLALEALENTTPTGFNMERDKQFFAAITAIKEVLAQSEQEPVVQWHLSKDGLPPVGSEVVGGYFYKDTWLKGEPEVFAWGQCRVIKDDHPDFLDGKRWITFGPSHNQITYWCWPPKKPGDTSPPQPEQSQVEETLRYEIDALEAKLAECRAQQPEQEPEAWYDKHGMFTHDPFEGVTPLYTTPPQRTWVGLMDEEIVAICQSVFGIDPILDGNLRKYAKAFEAKLKQKNGYAEEENI